MVSSLSTDEFIIITILNGDWQAEYKGDPTKIWEGMMQEYFKGFNNHLEERFPGHVLNILPLLQANPDGSTLDSLSLVHNISLQSNRIDQLHLNTKGNGIVAGGIFGMLRTCKLNNN